MSKGKNGSTVQTVEALVTPALEEMGLRVWDIRFEKEGPDWFLRILIDRDTPLDFQTCEQATHMINPILDEADPIQESYYLEVGSPGLGCRLTRESHFQVKQGAQILAHLIRPDENGNREIRGILKGKQDQLVLIEQEDGSIYEVQTKQASYFKLCDDENLF